MMAPLLMPASIVTWAIVAVCCVLAGALAYESWGKS